MSVIIVQSAVLGNLLLAGRVDDAELRLDDHVRDGRVKTFERPVAETGSSDFSAGVEVKDCSWVALARRLAVGVVCDYRSEYDRHSCVFREEASTKSSNIMSSNHVIRRVFVGVGGVFAVSADGFKTVLTRRRLYR